MFYFVFEGNFPSTSPRGAYNYLEGRFNGGFFVLLLWGPYIWRGLYMEGLIFGILRYMLCTLYSIFPEHCPHRTQPCMTVFVGMGMDSRIIHTVLMVYMVFYRSM